MRLTIGSSARSVTIIGLLAGVMGAPPVARADDFVVHGAFTAEAPHQHILDTSVAARFPSTIPGCVKKLLVLTQCFGGNFLDEFISTPNVAIASATDEGQLSQYEWYDVAAAGASYHDPGRTAADLHAEASLNAHPDESPQIGGGMPLSDFPMDLEGQAAQSKLHILYYAGRPNQVDVNIYWLLREHNPYADFIVVSTGDLAFAADYPPTQSGFASAMEVIGSHMTGCDHQFMLFVSDHGELIFQDVDPELSTPSQPTTIDTPALPVPLGPALLGTPDARPLFVIFVPLFGTGTTVDPNGAALFAPGAWQISVPITGGTYVSSDFIQVLIGGEDGVVGDDPGDGVRLEFVMPVATFIDAFVGHTNTVTITNFDGRPWTIEVSLDPGPIRKVMPPLVCNSPDFDGDGDTGTDADIEAFFACLGGECCDNCGSPDFNNDGDFGTDLDIEAFFRVLGGGAC